MQENAVDTLANLNENMALSIFGRNLNGRVTLRGSATQQQSTEMMCGIIMRHFPLSFAKYSTGTLVCPLIGAVTY